MCISEGQLIYFDKFRCVRFVDFDVVVALASSFPFICMRSTRPCTSLRMEDGFADPCLFLRVSLNLVPYVVRSN
jgi:hypothetical protein